MYIVKPEALKGKVDVVILDCRFDMDDPQKGRKLYQMCHIEGAQYVDLDEDLVGEISEHGGRHPLRDLAEIRRTLEALGVDDKKEVYIYDSGEMPMAAVLWYVLQLVGKNAYVVEGGFDALMQAGFALSDCAQAPLAGELKAPDRLALRADVNDALRSIEDDCVALVDARGPNRYLGLEEPKDKIAGHIPGALNIFWQDLLTADGRLKGEAELLSIFAPLDAYDEVIFQCGSGITGAVNLLVYAHLGKSARLYSGSYSDYISYRGNKIIVKGGKELVL
ncbi:MAG: sulfurtransferase [Clostridiales bacterium]|nr:MAG: sulfurtransferase [Clostridiales bacterium]